MNIATKERNVLQMYLISVKTANRQKREVNQLITNFNPQNKDLDNQSDEIDENMMN